jgi:hypothetical protein
MIFKAMDVNSDNQITFTEFLAATLNPAVVDLEELSNAFALLDGNRDGYIDATELRKIYTFKQKSYSPKNKTTTATTTGLVDEKSSITNKESSKSGNTGGETLSSSSAVTTTATTLNTSTASSVINAKDNDDVGVIPELKSSKFNDATIPVSSKSSHSTKSSEMSAKTGTKDINENANENEKDDDEEAYNTVAIPQIFSQKFINNSDMPLEELVLDIIDRYENFCSLLMMMTRRMRRMSILTSAISASCSFYSYIPHLPSPSPSLSFLPSSPSISISISFLPSFLPSF